MARPIPPELREAVEQDIRDGNPRNQIARDRGVSAGTVTNIAKRMEAEGAAPAFDRSATKDACAALQVDYALQRSKLAALLMADTFKVRDRMWADQVDYVAGGEMGAKRIERPTNAAEFRHFGTTIGILIDKVGVLTDTGQAEKEASSLIRSLVDDIRTRRARPEPPAATDAAV